MRIHQWLKLRFIRFVFAGSAAFVVDATVLALLTGIAGWQPTTARLISFPTAVTVNWLLHRIHVFEATSEPGSEYLRFFAVQILSATVNLGVYFVAVVSSALMARWPILALAIGSALAMFVTYYCNSRFVFAQRGS
jgi:putative flippase GtrA